MDALLSSGADAIGTGDAVADDLVRFDARTVHFHECLLLLRRMGEEHSLRVLDKTLGGEAAVGLRQRLVERCSVEAGLFMVFIQLNK